MFVFNVELTFSKRLKLFLASSAIVAAIICIVCMVSLHNRLPDTATCDEVPLYHLDAKGEQGRKDFLEQLGITVKGKPVASQKIVIPARFNETYENYNRLQEEIGLDLELYKGREAEKYTYELEGSGEKYAVILVCENKVIGGHLTNGEYGSKDLPLV